MRPMPTRSALWRSSIIMRDTFTTTFSPGLNRRQPLPIVPTTGGTGGTGGTEVVPSYTTTSSTSVSVSTTRIKDYTDYTYKIEVVDEKGELIKISSLSYDSVYIHDASSEEPKITTIGVIVVDNPHIGTHSVYRPEEKPSYSNFKAVLDGSSDKIIIPDSDVKSTFNEENNTYSYTITIRRNKSVLYGDANCDGSVSLADAVLIMQSLANPSMYGTEGTANDRITEQGKRNGDCSGNNDGITNLDALAVQKLMLKIIDSLPER